MSVVFDSNNNESLAPAKSRIYPESINESVNQLKAQIEQRFQEMAECPSELPKNNKSVRVVIKRNRGVQATPNVRDKYTQVQVERRPPLKTRAGKISSNDSKQCQEPVDPLNDPTERRLTREMVLKALDELNCIFAMPRPATYNSDEETSSISDMSIDSAVTKEFPDIGTADKFEHKTEGVSHPIPAKDRSLAMKELAAKYLPKWKQKLLFQDDIPLYDPTKPGCSTHAQQNVFKTDTKGLIDQIKSMKIDQPSDDDSSDHYDSIRTQIFTSSAAAGVQSPLDKCEDTTDNEQPNVRLFHKTVVDRADLEKICDIPMALCREEKELLKAYREKKTIFVLK